MKTFRLILALAAVALTAVSCVEKSGKYQTLLAQRDSLLTVEQKYDQTLEILNEIETGFQSIREVEDRVMTQISDIENSKHNSHKAAARTLRWPGRSNVCRKK